MTQLQSLIGIYEKRLVRAISCYQDGGVTGVGATLLKYYSDPVKLKSLLKLGDIESLGIEIGEKHYPKFEYHLADYTSEQLTKLRQWCCAYHRDYEWDKELLRKFYLGDVIGLYKDSHFDYIYIYLLDNHEWRYSQKPFYEWHSLYASVAEARKT